MSDQALRSKLIRLAHANPGPLREVLLPLLKEAASYAWKSMRGGDYAGAGSTAQLVKDMTANARRIETREESSHFVEQVQYAQAARTISRQEGSLLMEIVDLRQFGSLVRRMNREMER